MLIVSNRSQTQLNRQSFQTKGLVAFFPVLPQDSSYQLKNLAGVDNAKSSAGYKKIGYNSGNAALLNGTSQNFFVTATNSTVFGGSSFTFHCDAYFNTIATGTTLNNELFERDNETGTTLAWGAQLIMAGPKLVLYLVNQNATTTPHYGNTSLVTKTWYSITSSYNISSNVWKIYLNGKVDGTGTFSATSLRGTGHLLSLGATQTSERRVSGAMSNIRYYNRTFRDSEVMEMYRNPKGIFELNSNYISESTSISPTFNESQFFMVM
jgi:hypothetical protein